jgi:hypothetical protein
VAPATRVDGYNIRSAKVHLEFKDVSHTRLATSRKYCWRSVHPMRKLSGTESVCLQTRLDVPKSSLQFILEYQRRRPKTIGLPRGILNPITPEIRKVAGYNTSQSDRNAWWSYDHICLQQRLALHGMWSPLVQVSLIAKLIDKYDGMNRYKWEHWECSNCKVSSDAAFMNCLT